LATEHHHIVENWTTPYTSIFTNLAIYVAYTFFGSILVSSLLNFFLCYWWWR
jgi:hypothetical protein